MGSLITGAGAVGAFLFVILAAIRIIVTTHSDRVKTYQEIAVIWKGESDTCNTKLASQVTISEALVKTVETVGSASETRDQRIESKLDTILTNFITSASRPERG